MRAAGSSLDRMTPEVQLLVEAFADDPLMSYFWPDPVRRRRALPLFWHSRVEARRRAGIVDSVADEQGVRALVLWERPGVTPPMAEPLSLIRALGTAAPRALAASRRIEALRPHTPHLYLAAAATAPRARGQGIGSELVRDRIKAAAADVFAVTTNANSANIAEHMGFVPTGEVVIGEAVLRGMLLTP